MVDRAQLLAGYQAFGELQRRGDDDPLRQLQLFGKQPDFCASEKPIVAYFGANRSGKSTALARIIASMARTGNLNPKPAQGGPGIWIYDRAVSIWAIGQTFPLLRETFIPLVLDNGFVSPSQRHAPLIPKSELQFWHTTESIGKLKNGSIITFKSGEAPATVFAAATRDLSCYDEPPRDDVWNECSIRIGSSGEQLKIRIAATLLPEEQGIEASWLYPKLVEPWQLGARPDVEIFSASIYDNPHLDPDEVERMERQFPPGTPEHDIRILGKLVPGISGIMAFPRFNAGIHMTEDLGPWSVNHALPLCICLDFNVFPMVAEIGQQLGTGEESEFQFLDEICFKPGTISDVGEEFRRRYPHHGAEIRIYGDSSGQWSNQQTGVSNFAVLLDSLKGYPAPVRLCVPPKNPGIIERLNGFNRLLRDGHGKVRVRISAAHCPELEKDLKYVQRDPRTIIKKSSKPSDPYRERTHASEAASYWTAYEAPLPAYAALAQRRRVRHIPSPQYGFGQAQGQSFPTLLGRWR